MSLNELPREFWFPKNVRQVKDVLETERDEFDCENCGLFLSWKPGTIQECECGAVYALCSHVVDYKVMCKSIQTGTHIFMCAVCLKAQVKKQDFFEYWVLKL